MNISKISTNWTITSIFKLVDYKKDHVRNVGLGLGQAQKCGRIKLVNEISTLPSL